MKLAAFALALIALAAAPQEKTSIYAFPKDEAQSYEVVGELKISLAGSHKDFLEKGNTTPLKLDYRARFENVVTGPVGESKPADLIRRVMKLHVTGEFKGEALKVDFDPTLAEEKRWTGEGHVDLVNLFRGWCSTPSPFQVSLLGKVIPSHEALNRLLLKAGMMYWQIQPDQATWDTKEKIAVPMIHHKIELVFHNKYVRTEERGNRKFMIIEAKAEMAGSEAPEPEAPREIPSVDPKFKATGGAKVEIDLTKGRLHSTRINVRIEFSGEAPVADGAKGPLNGEVTFSESQVYKEKP